VNGEKKNRLREKMMSMLARVWKLDAVQNMPDVQIPSLLSARLGCGSSTETLGQRSVARQEAKNRSFLKFFSFLYFSISHQFTTKLVIQSQGDR
jgi:hypothetical protein